MGKCAPFGRLQTAKGGNKMIQGVVKGHFCHWSSCKKAHLLVFAVDNRGFHRRLTSHRERSVRWKEAKSRRLESMRRKRG